MGVGVAVGVGVGVGEADVDTADVLGDGAGALDDYAVDPDDVHPASVTTAAQAPATSGPTLRIAREPFPPGDHSTPTVTEAVIAPNSNRERPTGLARSSSPPNVG